MKKLLPLITAALIVCLFAGCPLNSPQPDNGNKMQEKGNKTQLKITNQSSRHLTLADYDSISFSTDELAYVKYLPTGKSCVKDFTEESNSFLRFTVYSKEYSKKFGWVGKKYEVRTSELIATESGKTKLFTVTDNTLVIINGTTTPVTLSSLYEDSTTVSIKNETSRMLKEVKFAEKTFAQKNGEFNKGAAVIQSFTDACKGYVYFTIHERDHHVANDKADTEHGENYSCAVYKVRTLNKFSVEKYEAKEIVIDDTTRVVKIGETDNNALHISELLKNDALLKIENATIQSLYRIKYGDDAFIDALNINNAYEKDFTFNTDEMNEYISFALLPGKAAHRVRTAEKISLKKGMAKVSSLTGATMVVKDGESTPVALSTLLYTEIKMTITNSSSNNLYNISYQQQDFGIKNEYNGSYYLHIGNSASNLIYYRGDSYSDHIYFEVDHNVVGGNHYHFKARTHEKIEVNRNKPYTFTIDDYTLIVKEGTTEAVTLNSLFD
ncbi:MAG: hypothetical protein ACTTH7_09910 [Treponema sp.]